MERVAGGRALPAEVVKQVVAKTDGAPFFVEELTKRVLDSGLVQERGDHYKLGGALPPLAIPSTLQDSLVARLDRMATVKDVAQLDAAPGRTFPYELLRGAAAGHHRLIGAVGAPAAPQTAHSHLAHPRLFLHWIHPAVVRRLDLKQAAFEHLRLPRTRTIEWRSPREDDAFLE